MTPSRDTIKFIIPIEEWKELSLQKRERIKELLLEYGYNISQIDEEE